MNAHLAQVNKYVYSHILIYTYIHVPDTGHSITIFLGSHTAQDSHNDLSPIKKGKKSKLEIT